MYSYTVLLLDYILTVVHGQFWFCVFSSSENGKQA